MIIAYKLFRVRADGTLGSLFINRSARLPVGKVLRAKCHRTKGYKERSGWHAVEDPRKVKHLSMDGRAWFMVQLQGAKKLRRPKNQGTWYIANKMKILGRAEPGEWM